jgi:homoserine dehydrogenase
VAVSPGIGFGDYGDDHVRFALIENEQRIRQAVRGIKEMFRKDGLMPRSRNERLTAALAVSSANEESTEPRPQACASACSASAPSAAAPSRCFAATRTRSPGAPGAASRSHRSPTSTSRARAGWSAMRCRVSDDAFSVVRDPQIDIVVELIGGYGIARTLVLEAIARGKHVVTANKALLAQHGNEIFAAAREQGVMVAFEAAVAGGIPIIKALREGLTANRIEWIAGIINGTSNFILSEMRDKGLPFDTVLKQAQRLGYAEADPTFDIEGVDAAHKLTIMSAIAFGIPMQFDAAYVEGISARCRGHPLRRAARLPDQAARHHASAPTRHRTACASDAVPEGPADRQRRGRDERGAGQGRRGRRDDVLRQGRGCGAHRLAVVADLVDVTRMHTADPENHVPHLAFQPDAMADLPSCRSRTSRLQLLPAHAGGGRAGRAGRHHAHPRRRAHQHRRHAAARAGQGEHQTDIILLTHDALRARRQRGDASHRGAARRCWRR